MMLPFPAAHMAGPNSWQGKRTLPVTLSSKHDDQLSREMLSNEFSDVTFARGSLPPAALTSTDAVPRLAVTFSRNDRRLAREEASARKKSAFKPALRILVHRAFPRSSFRPAIATAAPAAARASARAPPRTPVPPITKATTPERSKRLFVFCGDSSMRIRVNRAAPRLAERAADGPRARSIPEGDGNSCGKPR